MLGALTVAAVRMQLGHSLDRVAWSAALVLVLLVLLRQVLLVLDLLAAAGRSRACGPRGGATQDARRSGSAAVGS
jgi:hypothetical protein